MEIVEYSVKVPDNANTVTVAISTSSAASGVLQGESILFYSTVDCFVIRSADTTPGAAPTATTSCMPCLAGVQYRSPWRAGNQLAAITAAGTGSLYITPGA